MKKQEDTVAKNTEYGTFVVKKHFGELDVKIQLEQQRFILCL